MRDFIGYGPNPPNPNWPNNAKLAISFVLNYEEGGENSILNGDSQSETFLNEVKFCFSLFYNLFTFLFSFIIFL